MYILVPGEVAGVWLQRGPDLWEPGLGARAGGGGGVLAQRGPLEGHRGASELEPLVMLK